MNGLRVDTVVEQPPPVLAGQARPGKVALLLEPLAIFAVTRGCLVILAYLATLVLPVEDHARHQFPFGGLLDPWQRWDANWYTFIVEHGYLADRGYRFVANDAVSSIAFFPLYPLLIRAITPLVGNTTLAGWLIANLALALALCCLYRLVTLRFDRDTARRAALLLSCFPYAFFLGAVYTESLFLLLALAAFWLAERKQWWLAGLAGGLCSATRLVGLTLAPALALLYLQQRHYRWRTMRFDVLALCLLPLGFASFVLYQYLAFGEPLAMIKASSSWLGVNPFLTGFAQLDPRGFGPGNWRLVLALNLAVALLSLAAVIPIGRLLGPSYALFVLLSVLIPLSVRTESLGRFVAVLFPVFVVAAYYVRGRVAFGALLYGSTLLLTLFTILFANGYLIL